MNLPNLGPLERRNLFDGSLLYPDGSFEKKTGREKYEASKSKIREMFFYDERGALRKECLEPRNCPACGGSEGEEVFVKEGFPHLRCTGCGLVYVAPLLTDEALTRYYEQESEWTQVMLSGEERRVNTIMYDYVLEYLEAGAGEGRKLLDVGAGSGLFLEVAQNRGWETVGIELNQAMVAMAAEKGIKMVSRSIDDVRKEEGPFDVVTLWFVLEHIKELDRFMDDIRRALKPGGLLFVIIPQLDCLAYRLLGKESPTFAGYSHINFFNIDSLARLVEKHGFAPEAAETMITQLNTIKRYFARAGVSPGSGIHGLIDQWTPEFIHKHLLGTNLAMAARKPRQPGKGAT